jgi:hypothetical protein
MSKKIVKLAMIRKENEDACPFGLPILLGCKNVGDLIDKMAPINVMGEDSSEEEKQAIITANNHLLNWKSPGAPCKYADKIIGNKEAVECDWGTNTAGEAGGTALEGSPWYYKHFSGIGLDGLYSYPLGYFSDNSIDRGMYTGMFSIESVATDKNINMCLKCGKHYNGNNCC